MIDKIEAETFIHESEDESKVKDAFLCIIPVKDLIVNEKNVSFGTRMKIISCILTRKEEIDEVIKNIRNKMDNISKENLERTIEDRIDNKGNLFLRFDKQKAFTKKVANLNAGDDCIFVKIHFRSSPSKKYKFIEEAKKVLL
ncbi:MAG: hypothetical protein OH319_02495 [Candidatus Parvarchaeota archaeon]|nr:hypothetical protein [Candidatus Jingweiarchaeum tengchongense]MCW1298237.1 hypothetical protein [Candidatus Jingweiarchaeum tengchongense]MCW1300035.1 hypothetical protein [Candidatus Jingweiarchaeum tengchongense]MCW1304826.1 hypothetical protein [Candidatus Jingweiarchaeum tengchongense]MCW1305416.1 hypothetical protein [Candidatus Jingweiarchaeum tengchongense]